MLGQFDRAWAMHPREIGDWIHAEVSAGKAGLGAGVMVSSRQAGARVRGARPEAGCVKEPTVCPCLLCCCRCACLQRVLLPSVPAAYQGPRCCTTVWCIPVLLPPRITWGAHGCGFLVGPPLLCRSLHSLCTCVCV
jgi:hypothetical protein